MKDTCHYTVVDAYPGVETRHFEDFGGAVVGCWVTPQSIGSAEDLGRLIEARLADEGWEIAGTISSKLVTAEDYDGKTDGWDLFEQALTDDFVAQIHRWPREVIPLREEAAEQGICSAARYLQFVEALRAKGALSLSSTEDEQWANGVSPNGGDFLPLWASESALTPWREYWPDHEIEALSMETLCAGGFLESVEDHEMLIALGIGQSLVLTHPLRLLKDLQAG